MDPSRTNKSLSGQLKDNYKWRRFKVGYVVIAVIIILIMAISILAVNQQATCETASRQSWGQITGSANASPDISTSCLSASARGEGISFAIIIIPIVLAFIGYKLLPRLYIYLTPGK
jgi:hypothetical protein